MRRRTRRRGRSRRRRESKRSANCTQFWLTRAGALPGYPSLLWHHFWCKSVTRLFGRSSPPTSGGVDRGNGKLAIATELAERRLDQNHLQNACISKHWGYTRTHGNGSFLAVVNLLRVAHTSKNSLRMRLAAVHGLTLKEVLLLMHLEPAPRVRLSRVDLENGSTSAHRRLIRTTIPLERWV